MYLTLAEEHFSQNIEFARLGLSSVQQAMSEMA